MKQKNLMSIKDFSQATGIAPSTLRFWDNIDLLPPMVRGENNQYRYYSCQQITWAKSIKMFSDLRIPTKFIRELQEKRSLKSVLLVLEQHEGTICADLHQLSDIQLKTYTLCNDIRRFIADSDFDAMSADPNLKDFLERV